MTCFASSKAYFSRKTFSCSRYRIASHRVMSYCFVVPVYLHDVTFHDGFLLNLVDVANS